MNLLVKIIKKLPSGHLGGLATPWSHPPEQILRPCNNQSHTPAPVFPENMDRRKKERKKEFYFFWNYNIL